MGVPWRWGAAGNASLLAMLLVRANESVSVDRLIDQLWGNASPVDAANALQVHVSRLRRALSADGALETGSAGYRLLVAAGALDAGRFEAAVQRGRDARDAGHLSDAAAALRGALGSGAAPRSRTALTRRSPSRRSRGSRSSG